MHVVEDAPVRRVSPVARWAVDCKCSTPLVASAPASRLELLFAADIAMAGGGGGLMLVCLLDPTCA